MSLIRLLPLLLKTVLSSKIPLASCSGGSNSCIFPWTYEGRIHTSCTTLDDPGKPWCATGLDSKGNMVKWSYCEESCPRASNRSDYIAPMNQPGQCCKQSMIKTHINWSFCLVCGVPNLLQSSRIIGGQEAQHAEYPWQVPNLLPEFIKNFHFIWPSSPQLQPP